MNGLLSALESDESSAGIAARNKELRKWRRKRRTNRRLKKPVFDVEDFLLDVKHTSYGIHSFAEEGAPGWDPRYVCAADGSLSLSPGDTDRGTVLKTFFGRN